MQDKVVEQWGWTDLVSSATFIVERSMPYCSFVPAQILNSAKVDTFVNGLQEGCKKNDQKNSANQTRSYMSPAFVISLELWPDLSKNISRASHQIFTLHFFQWNQERMNLFMHGLRKGFNKKLQKHSRYKTYCCIQNHTNKWLIPRKTNQIFPSSV